MAIVYTFSTMGSNGKKYYPKRAEGSQGYVISDWTTEIKEAMTWNNPRDFDCLMAEYYDTTIETVELQDE